MAVIFAKVSKRIFQILKGNGYTVYLFDDNGTRVYDPEQATKFFAEPANMMVLLNKNDTGELQINLSQSFNIKENRNLLDSLRQVATRFNLDYALKEYGQELTPKDFADLTEGRMYGSTKTSYQKIGECRLIVRHSARVSEEVRGSRSRKIRETFIEDSVGQRFRMPTNWLAGNRAICNFIAEGGDLYSDTGRYLQTLTEDYVNLSYLNNNLRKLEETEFRNQVRSGISGILWETKDIMTGLTRKTRFNETVEKINSIDRNILTEDELETRVLKLAEGLEVNKEDPMMEKALNVAARHKLDERKKKEPIDFEVTPKIEEWANFLKKADRYSAGQAGHERPFRFGDPEDPKKAGKPEDIEHDEFLRQAKRLVNKEISAFSGAKPLAPNKQFSRDPKIARLQGLMYYYENIAQMLDPQKDVIIANLISRLADHFERMVQGEDTTMNTNDQSFAAMMKLGDMVGKMVGAPRPEFKESRMTSIRSDLDRLTEWFKRFDSDNIVKEEKAKKLREQKKALEAKIKKIKEAKAVKAKKLEEDQQKFFQLTLDLATSHNNPEKVRKLTRNLNENQKKRLVRVIGETWDRKVVRNIAEALGVQPQKKVVKEGFDWASVSFPANMGRLKAFSDKAGALGERIANAIEKCDCEKETKKGLGNVLSHVGAFADEARIWQDPDEKFESSMMNAQVNPRETPGVTQIAKALKKLIYMISDAHGVGDGLPESRGKMYESKKAPKKTNKKKLTEAKDGRKAASAFGSSRDVERGLERAGSPRAHALEKARFYVSKGNPPGESLERAGLPNTPENRRELAGAQTVAKAQQDKATDRYAQMAAKLGLNDSIEESNEEKAPEEQTKSKEKKMPVKEDASIAHLRALSGIQKKR